MACSLKIDNELMGRFRVNFSELPDGLDPDILEFASIGVPTETPLRNLFSWMSLRTDENSNNNKGQIKVEFLDINCETIGRFTFNGVYPYHIHNIILDQRKEGLLLIPVDFKYSNLSYDY